jgi:hypothetical protein
MVGYTTHWVRLGAAAILTLATGSLAFAQGYETRPIEEGPSMNSFDMWTGRAGNPRENLTTKIAAIDATARTLTAETGEVFILANNLNVASLRTGQSVMLQWEADGARKVLHGITPIGN